VKGEDEIQNQIVNSYGFVDDLIENIIKCSNLYEEKDIDYEARISEHNVYTSISINKTLYRECMNLLSLPVAHHIHILDGGVDTCVLRK
jgi:hypothetical protein